MHQLTTYQNWKHLVSGSADNNYVINKATVREKKTAHDFAVGLKQ